MHFHAMAGLALAFFSLSLAKDIDPKIAKDPDSQARTPLAKRQTGENPIIITYLRGTLAVTAYETQEESKRANTDGSKAHYAYLLLRPLPDKDAYDKVLALIGIQPLARTYFEANGQIYEQWKIPRGSLGLGKMARVLAKEAPEYFFNLIPIDRDWKLSPKMAGLRDFKKEEIQEETGKVCGAVLFFGDIPKAKQSELLTQYLPPRQAEDKCHYAYRSDFAGMADLEEVEYVIERDTVSPITNDRTRSLINVNTLSQPFPTHQTTPRVNWLDTGSYASNYYGREVIVGVYDTGIDTGGTTITASDFREQDGANRNQVRRGLRNVVTGWHPFNQHNAPTHIEASDWVRVHGSHVAGIIGGNGWNSRTSGAPTNFLWRGIAPRVQFFSQDGENPANWAGFAGHVNNHSHVSDWGNYDGTDASIDQVIQNHATTHTMVYAAANSGLTAGNGRTPQGYYSLLANAKNPITVGASYNDTLLRARFSSMGPTRDGRIKPDIMAPGASFNYPNYRQRSIRVEINSIRFLRQGGAVAREWLFNSQNNLENWANWIYATPIGVNNSTLVFNYAHVLCMIQNTAIGNYTAMPNDELEIIYRVKHPQIPSKMTRMRIGMRWNTANNGGVDHLRFSLATPDTTNFQTARFVLRNLWGPRTVDDASLGIRRWPTANQNITQLSFTFGDNFGSDTSHSILSANTMDPNASRYMMQQGTSMAAPVVTGTVALLLEKWARVVRPGANLDTQGPWNSTVKALLVQSATDMVKTAADPEESAPGADGVINVNKDLCGYQLISGVHTCTRNNQAQSFVQYPAGPDYATGYGLINASKALQYVDSNRIRQANIAMNATRTYTFQMPSGRRSARFTLAWDDAPGPGGIDIRQSQLVNDLDLVVQAPNGQVYHPYFLNLLPQGGTNVALPGDGLDPIDPVHIQAAQRGVNTRDNVEVVDVASGSDLPTGEWRVIIRAPRVLGGTTQDFSLISDFTLASPTSAIGWLYKGQNCPEGIVSIGLDDEDDQPNGTQGFVKTGWNSSTWLGYTGQSGIWNNSGETRLDFCRQSFTAMPPYQRDYAALKLSGNCPTGSHHFTVLVDNENDQPNGNYNSGTTSPSPGSSPWPTSQTTGPGQQGITTFQYCFYPGNNSTTTPPWRAGHHGALVGVNADISGCNEFHWHIEDDQDAGNENQYGFTAQSSPFAARIKALFNWTSSSNNQPDMHYFWNACP